MSQLIGAPACKRRIKAVTGWQRDLGRKWQRETVPYVRRGVPVRTGKTRASVRPGPITATRATIVGNRPIFFIDSGTKAHDEPRSRFTKAGKLRRGKAAGTGKVLKFDVGGRAIFRRKVHKPAIGAHRFRRAAVMAGLRKVNPLRIVGDLWNKAA